MAVVCWVGSVNKGGGAVVSQILSGDPSLLLICSSWSFTWFLGRRSGLLAPCAHFLHCLPDIFGSIYRCNIALWP